MFFFSPVLSSLMQDRNRSALLSLYTTKVRGCPNLLLSCKGHRSWQKGWLSLKKIVTFPDGASFILSPWVGAHVERREIFFYKFKEYSRFAGKYGNLKHFGGIKSTPKILRTVLCVVAWKSSFSGAAAASPSIHGRY